jgi:hypothetical protein
MNAPRERYLRAGEMSAALREIGIDRSDKWVRAAWVMGAPNTGREGLMSEMLTWMKQNPGAKPMEQSEIGVSNL